MNELSEEIQAIQARKDKGETLNSWDTFVLKQAEVQQKTRLAEQTAQQARAEELMNIVFSRADGCMVWTIGDATFDKDILKVGYSQAHITSQAKIREFLAGGNVLSLIDAMPDCAEKTLLTEKLKVSESSAISALSEIYRFELCLQMYSRGVKLNEPFQENHYYQRQTEVRKFSKTIWKYFLSFTEGFSYSYGFSSVFSDKILTDCVELLYTHVENSYSTDFRGIELVQSLGSNSNDVRKVLELIRDYGYEYKSLIGYIIHVVYREAVTVSNSVTMLRDYAMMRRAVNGGRLESSEKYPRWLKTRHDVVSENYKSIKQTHEKEIFQANAGKHFEFSKGKYQVVAPIVPDDVVAEGTNLKHCVGSYVGRIVSGKLNIVFLRKTDDPEKSLVTLEISSGQIHQAKAMYNRRPNPDIIDWLVKYSKEKKLHYTPSTY